MRSTVQGLLKVSRQASYTMGNVLKGQLLATCGYLNLNSLKLGVINNSVLKSHEPHFKCSFTPGSGQLRTYISFVARSPTGQQLTSIVLALNV